MNVVKMLLTKMGHFLLTVMGVLRRALCCFRRRRRMSDSSLPMTNHDLGRRFTSLDQNGGSDLQNWDSWTDGETMSIQVDAGQTTVNRPNMNRFERTSLSEDRKSDDDVEDLFKDMVPTIRRTKKYLVKQGQDESSNCSQSNRLAVDMKATSSIFHQSSELGVLDDHVETWEDVTELESELWPETALREQKLAERERRLAEHQRRKQEKEQGRTTRSNSNPGRLS